MMYGEFGNEDSPSEDNLPQMDDDNLDMVDIRMMEALERDPTQMRRYVLDRERALQRRVAQREENQKDDDDS